MAVTLDGDVKERVRAVLDSQPVTEAELRKLAEEGRACALILGGRLERAEERLVELNRYSDSSLADIAATLRDVNELRPDLDELQSLLDELNVRARQYRSAWVSS